MSSGGFGGDDYNVGVTGVFGQLSIEPTSRLILTAGGRYDRLDLENTLTSRSSPSPRRWPPARAARRHRPGRHQVRLAISCEVVQLGWLPHGVRRANQGDQREHDTDRAPIVGA